MLDAEYGQDALVMAMVYESRTVADCCLISDAFGIETEPFPNSDERSRSLFVFPHVNVSSYLRRIEV
jgi:hypothetical protein